MKLFCSRYARKYFHLMLMGFFTHLLLFPCFAASSRFHARTLSANIRASLNFLFSLFIMLLVAIAFNSVASFILLYFLSFSVPILYHTFDYLSIDLRKIIPQISENIHQVHAFLTFQFPNASNLLHLHPTSKDLHNF